MDADTLDGAPVPTTIAGDLRRIQRDLAATKEALVVHIAEERGALANLERDHVDALDVQRQTATGITRLVAIQEARAEAQAEADRKAQAEAERSAAWWRSSLEAVTSNRLVQIIVLVSTVALVPELRPLIAAYLGAAAPAPAPVVEHAEEPSP